MSKTINVEVTISSDSRFCEEPCHVKGHIGNVCRFAIEPYWMFNYEKYQEGRFCKLFNRHLSTHPNNGKTSWLKCDKCLANDN